MKSITLLKTLIVALFLMIGVGNAWGQSTYTENFDTDGNWAGGSMTGYNAKTYTNNASDPSNDVFSTNAAVRETSDVNSGNYAWRVDDNNGFYLRYECEEIVNSFSVWMARWDNSPKPNVTIRYSTNSGTSYTDIETIDGDWFTGDKVYKQYSHTFGSAISPEVGEKVYIEFYTNSGERMLYDDFEISYGASSGPDDPTSFNATATSTTQIDLAATANGDTDDILVAYNSSNTFGTPSGAYSVGNLISGGGTVHYVGAAASLTNHTGLSAGQTVYYKAWSVNGSTEYSNGVEANATTLNPEPSNHASSFTAAANGHNQIDLSWGDNDGAQAADGFLIVGKTGAGSYLSVTDGTDPADDTDWSDNNFNVKVAHGVEAYSVTGLNAETQYDFKIYPYTNSGNDIDFKTDGTVPEDDATTGVAPLIETPTAGKVFISEVSDAASNFNAEFLELFNNSGKVIDLTNSKIVRYPGVGGAAEYVWDFSTDGSGDIQIPANGILVIARGATKAEFESEWGALPNDVNYNEGNSLLYFGAGRQWALKDGGTSDTDDGTEIDATNQAVANGDRDYQYPTGTWNNDVEGNSNPGVIGSNEDPAAYEWDGGASTSNWGDANNWNPNQIPGANTNVTIPSSKQEIIIQPTIEADCYNLTVNGTLTIESNASNTGSIIINGSISGSGTITSERYMSGAETWRLVSSPVENQVISDVNNWTPTGSYTGGHGYDFYAYQESSATWLNQKVGANNITNFTPGQGYLVSFEAADQTKTYTGTFNNGDVTVSVSKTGTGDYAGANLIGNPYPSGIDWNDADRSLFSDNYAYVYDRVSNPGETYEGYVQVNGSAADAFIAPHQGFFVIKDAAGSSDFTFTNDMRAHGGTFTKTPANFAGLKLKVSTGSYYDIATISINETASFDRDRMDAIKFYSNNNDMPNFFTISKDNKQLAINTIPSIQIEEPIAMGITVPVNGAYEISLNEQGADFTDKVIYLEDLLTGIRHNLTTDGSYSYSASTSDNPNRFLLHFGVVGLDENDSEGSLRAYTYNNTLYVQNSLEAANIRILDMQGRLLLEQQLNGQGLQNLPLDLPAGVYVVQLVNSKAQKSVKVIVE